MTLTRSRLFFVLFLLALVSLWIAGLSWAQGSDTPIIISDGSLTMESRGVAWSRFTGTGGTRSHPNAGKAVTAVEVTANGSTQTINFNNEPCAVTVRYGATNIVVATENNGRGLHVSTDFTAFHRGASDNHLAHNDAGNHISAVTVRKGSQTVFSANPNGGTQIVIHYQ
jgi:hypothetical protein